MENPKDASGAALIELAFILPIVFLVFFFFLNFSLLANAAVSLNSAMSDAALIATTRGDARLLNLDIGLGGVRRNGIITPLDDWYNGGAASLSTLSTGTLGKLFLNNTDPAQFVATMESDVLRYQSPAEGVLTFQKNGGVSPDDYPLFYYYTLAYIYQAMEQSVGAGLKYPCRRPLTESSCLSCGFYATSAGADESTTQNLDNVPLKGTKDIHLVCRFKGFGFPEISRVIQIKQDEVLR
ncbi:pilus assembly protein [bacterium]|nr:pilus assembly protein [bacterium]